MGVRGTLTHYGAVREAMEEEHSRQRGQRGQTLKGGNGVYLRTCRRVQRAGTTGAGATSRQREPGLENHAKGLGLHHVSHVGSGRPNEAPRPGQLKHTRGLAVLGTEV